MAEAPDWRLLAPHRPLSPDDDAYVARPTGGGDEIARWIAAGGSTVLVSGPTGIGKSTELAHAAQALRSTRAVCLLQVDRLTNMHRLSADELMRLIADALVALARDELKLPVSEKLSSFRSSGAQVIRLAALEIERLSQQGRLALLVDGLEKLLPGPSAREIFDALSSLPESVDLVVVIPWHAAFGGGTESILRPGEHLHRVAALDVKGEGAATTANFFARVLRRRLRVDELPDAMMLVVHGAFMASGGIPRVFLQLVADAGTYARAKRGDIWPDLSDLREAVLDQEQSFRRALLPGDTKAIAAILGTDGRELDLERRVRLLAQGILLERARDGRVFFEAHPLVAGAIQRP
jgi:hypothetical protein